MISSWMSDRFTYLIRDDEKRGDRTTKWKKVTKRRRYGSVTLTRHKVCVSFKKLQYVRFLGRRRIVEYNRSKDVTCLHLETGVYKNKKYEETRFNDSSA
jgi:hypothetical protein